MKCPRCGNKIDDLEMKCMYCGMDLKRLDKNYGEKTIGLGIVNVLQLICFIILSIVSFMEEQVSQGFIYIAIGVITHFFIKGFSDVIDLLNSINNKLDK